MSVILQAESVKKYYFTKPVLKGLSSVLKQSVWFRSYPTETAYIRG